MSLSNSCFKIAKATLSRQERMPVAGLWETVRRDIYKVTTPARYLCYTAQISFNTFQS